MIADAAGCDRATQLVVDLYARHRCEVYAYLCRLLHNAQWAEDLAQETFVRALAEGPRLCGVENHRAWLYRVATNLALNALKRGRRFAWLPWRAAHDAGSPGLAEAIDRKSAVEAALAALPLAYRAPLLLYAHDGLSVAEVASVMGLSAAAVRTRISRAREMFERAYSKGGAR
ncbi:MAG TPA: RNA polymerase sigma factor [Anaerolineae bacterium]|nr:RNA polymerase sigma factor [Anaerolineae bacterium]HOR00458.1 RNA polymerase sigma factor [Anaerolineae bacterium]HPL28403.1 RNA polymerase sigma factor [Anaerolineae bacterium]